jgi:hypothetical protein
MRGLLAAIGVIGLGVLGWMLFTMVPASGVLANLEPKLVDLCRSVTVFPGTEDVTIDEETGIAFISADDRRATAAGAPVQGGIYALKLDGTDRVSKVSPESFGDKPLARRRRPEAAFRHQSHHHRRSQGRDIRRRFRRRAPACRYGRLRRDGVAE